MADDGKFQLSEQEGISFFQAMDISALNGIIDLSIALARIGVLSPTQVEHLHQSMSKPLQVPHLANNRGVQDAQQNLDTLFAEVRRIASRTPPPAG